MNTMFFIAINAIFMRSRCHFYACWIAAGLVAGCALPSPPPRPLVYDFGPGPLAPAASAVSAPRPALLIADIQTSSALDSTAMLYRQGFGNEQQLKAYTLARWSMPPAQLLRQRLRTQLGQQHTLLNPGELPAAGLSKTQMLRLELEEFSHWFERPDHSLGWVRLRATLTQPSPSGDRVLAQRSFQVQRPAPTADAAGAVRALSDASDAVVVELGAWVAGVQPL